jgi:hypothetical protein
VYGIANNCNLHVHTTPSEGYFMSSFASRGAAPAHGLPSEPRGPLGKLIELARRAGYRLEKASASGFWLLVDTDGELVRTPLGEKAWSAEAARRRLESVAPPITAKVA